MTDISNLLTRYQQLANKANGQDPNDRIKKMLKRHLRELAYEGGLDNTPLYSADAYGNCEEQGWIPCTDGSCVPPEVSC